MNIQTIIEFDFAQEGCNTQSKSAEHNNGAELFNNEKITGDVDDIFDTILFHKDQNLTRVSDIIYKLLNCKR